MESMEHKMGTSPYRGELVPMGTLESPDPLSTLRFTYPTLCVESRHNLWLWDIRTREMIQTFDLEPSIYYVFKISVDVNDTHVFVTIDNILVYSRASGECVFRLPHSWFGLLAPCVVDPTPVLDAGTIFQEHELQHYKDPGPRDRVYPGPEPVTAVRVSPSGDNFVATTERGLVFHISGLKSTTTEHGQPNSGTPESESDLDAPFLDSEDLDLGNNSVFWPGFKVSVAKSDYGLQSLAYDGDRILVHGVSP